VRSWAFGFPAVIARVDLARLVVRLESVLRAHGARTQAHAIDSRIRMERGGARAIASIALEGDRIARAVVSEVRVAPFFAGVAMVVRPRPSFDAPILVADLMVPPPGVTRAYVDVGGPSIARPSFASRFREPLDAALETSKDVKRSTVPTWIAALSGGAGARLKAKPLHGEAVADILVEYTERYLRALAAADPAKDAAANVEAGKAMRTAFQTHGKASHHLARAFGATFTERYMGLLWGDVAA
jgi:hypothetical protein